MLGAILGDICGSVYEFNPVKRYNFPLLTEASAFTDDTVLTLAIADALMNKKDIAKTLREYARYYSWRGYGKRFHDWVWGETDEPYWSFGNGSAMRVSSVGYLYDSLEDVLLNAEKTAEVTHNHPDGIKGAQAVALAIFLARKGASKEEIRHEIETRFRYNLSRTIAEIEKKYYFNETCQGSVPEAIIAFLESDDYESAIRNAIWLKGDADTQACIAGGIAEAFYKATPSHLNHFVYEKLPSALLEVLHQFHMYQAYTLELKETSLTKEQIDKIVSYIPYFEKAHEVDLYSKMACDSRIFSEFFKAIVDTNFYVVFNWMYWQAGREIFMQPERIDRADLLTARMLLTALWRNDRFCDGVLKIAIEDGTILRILKRVRFLHNVERS